MVRGHGAAPSQRDQGTSPPESVSSMHTLSSMQHLSTHFAEPPDLMMRGSGTAPFSREQNTDVPPSLHLPEMLLMRAGILERCIRTPAM